MASVGCIAPREDVKDAPSSVPNALYLNKNHWSSRSHLFFDSSLGSIPKSTLESSSESFTKLGEKFSKLYLIIRTIRFRELN